jgi:hypothetical protein
LSFTNFCEMEMDGDGSWHHLCCSGSWHHHSWDLTSDMQRRMKCPTVVCCSWKALKCAYFSQWPLLCRLLTLGKQPIWTFGTFVIPLSESYLLSFPDVIRATENRKIEMEF